jgi:hypothetical protein
MAAVGTSTTLFCGLETSSRAFTNWLGKSDSSAVRETPRALFTVPVVVSIFIVQRQ